MNILKITQMNKSYALEYKGQRLLILNDKALVWHLKKQAGLNMTQIASIQHMFQYQAVVEVDLSKVA